MRLAFFGSSLVSAKWNGAVTYCRGISRALAARGFETVFYEPGVFDRQKHRDFPDPEWCEVRVWEPTEAAARAAVAQARGADVIVKASGVGVFDALLEEAVLELQGPGTQVLFWDLDAPGTLQRLRANPNDPFRALVPRYDLVLTSGGGPRVIEGYEALGARKCAPISNALDPQAHHPVAPDPHFAGDLSFLANRLPDREARAKEFFFDVARALPEKRFVLGGAGWDSVPPNVEYAGPVHARDHNAFNTSPLAVLDVCHDSLFEAAGAGACLITDAWEGLETFLVPGEEVLVARSGAEVVKLLKELTPERARAIGRAARQRVLSDHTFERRADEVCELLGPSRPAMKKRAAPKLKVVFLGLSITSSWGNRHATTYRGLVRELTRRGHEVTFLERELPWYAAHRDLPAPPYGKTILYGSVQELERVHRRSIEGADVVVVGSYVPDGREIGDLVLENARGLPAFYDLDTPVTIAELERDRCEYLRRDQVARYGLYLSYTGGPILERIEGIFGSPNAQPLYCSADPELYRPGAETPRWDLSFMGTWSVDRQPLLEELLFEPARMLQDRQFVVSGAQYPETTRWPSNVERLDHIVPAEHARFYGSSRVTLNLTRKDMARAGHSPSVRLFEAAASGVPIASDHWAGIETFFEPGEEIVLVDSSAEVVELLSEWPEERLARMAAAARRRFLAHHTAARRAATFESSVVAIIGRARSSLQGLAPTSPG